MLLTPVRRAIICHTITRKTSVVYTGTHDNDTILGWYYVMSEEDREFSKEYMGNAKSTDEELPWDFIRMSMESVANLAVTPMQEFLGLGTEARSTIRPHLEITGNGACFRDSLHRKWQREFIG